MTWRTGGEDERCDERHDSQGLELQLIQKCPDIPGRGKERVQITLPCVVQFFVARVLASCVIFEIRERDLGRCEASSSDRLELLGQGVGRMHPSGRGRVRDWNGRQRTERHKLG
jgi:hypothetical protein